MASLTPAAQRMVAAVAEQRGMLKRISRNRFSQWIPVEAYPKQQEALQCRERFILLGGGMGGAKTFAAVMWLLAEIDRPGVRCLVLRTTMDAHNKANSVNDILRRWLAGTAARWSAGNQAWTFPSGSTIEFGSVHGSTSFEDRFQGAGWTKILIEEAGNWKREDIEDMGTRVRKGVDAEGTLGMMLTANPGGIANDYLIERFGIPEKARPEDRIASGNYRPHHYYIEYLIDDNPGVDLAEYEIQFAPMTVGRRAQMRYGDFHAVIEGEFAAAAWFQTIPFGAMPMMDLHVRGVDPCVTGNKDKLGTQLMTMCGETVYIEHAAELVVQLSELPDQLERWAMVDPPGTIIALEKSTMGIAVVQEMTKRGGVVVKELGQANEALVEAAAMSQQERRRVIPIVYVPQVGNKLFRTSLLLSDARHGRVKMVESAWNALFVKRYVNFRNFTGDVDDLIDAGSNARRVLMDVRPRQLTAQEAAPWTHRNGQPASTEEQRRAAFERIRAQSGRAG